MERELWKELYQLAEALDKSVRRGLYRASCIVSVYFWAVVHDRPVSWACDGKNWPSDGVFPAWYLPSQPTMSRRLRTTAVEQLLLAIEEEISEAAWTYVVWVKMIDAKPLPGSAYSKDPDAAWGRGAGKSQKGYKFYAIWEQRPLPSAWALAPMNVAEVRLGKELVKDLPGGGYLLGDKQYDASPMFDAAGKNNHQLVAPRKQKGKALGHRRNSPFRIRSIELLKTAFGRALFKERTQIERQFGNWTAFGSGLAPLPAWVRRFHRVRLWVHAKLLINALRIQRLRPVRTLAVA